MKFLLKLFLVVVLAVGLLAVVIRFAAPPIATRVINSTLKEKFGETSSFDGLSLSLLRGKVELGALRIAQPAGFGDGFFASYDLIEADLDVRSLASDTVVVETLRVVNPSFNYRVNADGLSNIEAALAAFAPTEPTAPEAIEAEPSRDSDTTEPSDPKKLIVRNLEILGVDFDASSEKNTRPVTIKLEDLNLEIRDLTFDPADPDFGPRILETAIVFSIGAFRASQPEGFEGETMVGLEGLDLAVSVSEARPDTLVVESLALEKPFASLQVNDSGANNIEALIDAFIPTAVTAAMTASEVPPVDPASGEAQTPPVTGTPPAKMMALALDAFRVEDAGFEILSADPTNPASIRMENLAVLLAGIQLDPATNSIEVAEINLNNAAFEIVRSKPTATTAEANLESAPAADGNETAEPKSAEPAVEAAPADSEPPAGRIALKRFQLAGFTARLRDEALMDTALEYTVDPIEATATGLVIDTTGAAVEPGSLELRFTLNQGEGLQNAEFVSLTRITDLNRKIPSLATALRFTGFDLEPFRPMLPPGTITALGGSGLDVVVDAKLSETLLDGTFAIINNKGNRTAIPIKGTPDKPEISIQAIFAAILGRPLDMAGNVASGALDATGELASGATDAAKNIASGAGDTAKKIGGGLLSGVKGLAQGDLGAVTEGVKDATVGAAGEAGKAAAETAGKATETVGGAAGAAAGGAKVERWRESTPARHAESLEAAREWLEAITFPLRPATAE